MRENRLNFFKTFIGETKTSGMGSAIQTIVTTEETYLT